MDGKTAIVTGANSGIGLETSRGLARLGARVVLAVRDPAKGEAARADIARTVPDARLDVAKLDLADLHDVRRFARHFMGIHPRLDVLVNNAGFHTSKRSLTEDGFESTFGVDHLGHFALTRELLPLLQASAPSRVVTVASEAHRGARVDWDDVQLARSWSGIRAYANAKLYNILFARQLATMVAGTRVTSNAVHPGSVRTGWARGRDSGLLRYGVALASPFLLSPARGADTSIWLAASEEVKGVSGRYFTKRKERAPSKLAQDESAALRLWEASEALVDAAFAKSA